ncbi:EamA family transporter RarD [Streptomyces sp. ST2-7A]|uniref:EamA family transporter RarD n=1 Tax=Streptomyces sp. ST2-7A TaxID=2907214 RepID=UPI001F45BE65|nr:EamA family transporter RarD [Streptomyces sp. ST2-7A]MCE7078877.1 EamA family transporter RarD [Streptomyces sp. ST2-7A]
MAYGLTAFGMWGLLPLYWALLASTGPAEVMAHRMLWSLPTSLLILAVVGRWAWIPGLLRQPKRLGLVAVSAALISVNWYLFIWAVANDRVIEASLGYFINPLITIALGVLLLRERLRTAQWAAVGIGLLAVVVMGVAYGRVPWLSLVLSVTFALYGLVKKRTDLDGLEGFSADAALQFLPALGFVILLTARGESSFVAEGAGHTLLLIGSGLATALPLIFFGAAAVRVPLSTVGLMQYIAPSTMFLLGVLVFGEEMPPERWIGFVMVWTALTILTWDVLRQAGRSRAALRAAGRAAGQRLAESAPTGPPEATAMTGGIPAGADAGGPGGAGNGTDAGSATRRG